MKRSIPYYIAFIALGLVTAALGPTLPELAARTSSHLGGISILFTTSSLGYMLGSLLGGQLYDRMRGHPVMIAALLSLLTLLALVPVVSWLLLLALVWFLIGAAQGTLDVGGNTLLMWVHGHEVGPYMNGLHFFFGVGATLSPLIIAQAARLGGDIAWSYWTLAVLMLPAVLLLGAQPSPVSRAEASAKGGNNDNPPLLVLLFVAFFFFYVTAESSFGGWIFTYATAMQLGEGANAALLTSAFWGALTVGRLVAIPIAVKLRPRFVLLGDLLGCLLGVAIVLLWPRSIAAMWVGTLLTGFSMASVFPTTMSLAERRLTITGQVTSFFFVGASLGGMALPWVIGQLFERIGPQVTMIGILVVLLIELLLWGVLISASRKRAALLAHPDVSAPA